MSEQLSAWDYCTFRVDVLRAKRGPRGIGWRMGRIRAGARERLTARFTAEAAGPNGPVIAAMSPEFTITGNDFGSEQAREAGRDPLNALFRHMMVDGWQILPERGGQWYSYTFRRQVRG
jgi:hypothetical protein